MIYRAVLGDNIIRKLGGFPPEGMDALTSLLGTIVEDPYDVLHSYPVGDDPHHRVAFLGSAGWVNLELDDDVGVVTVTDVIWVG